jgi:hypothetical protein
MATYVWIFGANPSEFESLPLDVIDSTPVPPHPTGSSGLKAIPHQQAVDEEKVRKHAIELTGNPKIGIALPIEAKDANAENLVFVASPVFASREKAMAFISEGVGQLLFEKCSNCVLYRLITG